MWFVYCRLLTFLSSPILCFCVLPDLTCEAISGFLCLMSLFHAMEIKQLFCVELLIHIPQVNYYILLVKNWILYNDYLDIRDGTSSLRRGSDGSTGRGPLYKLLLAGHINLSQYYNRSHVHITRFIANNIIQLDHSVSAYRNFGPTRLEAKYIESLNDNIKDALLLRKKLVDSADLHKIPLYTSRISLTKDQYNIVASSEQL